MTSTTTSSAAGRPSRAMAWVVAAVVPLAMVACSDDPSAQSTVSESGTEAADTAATTTVADDPETDASGTDDSGTDDTDPVDSGSTATTGSEDGEPRYQSGDDEYLFDQEQLHTFEIDLPEASLAQIDADPSAEEYVEGSLTFEGETISPIGIRYKGSVGAFVGCTAGANPLDSSGPKTCTKLSMKLKINWDDPDREFYGVRRVQLHAQNLDSSMMHERLGYWLFREMGVPAPRSTHARVVVNGEYLGVFALTEEIDGRFARAVFDDGTGNVYKEVWPFDANGAPRPAQDFIDGLETNEDDDPSADIITGFAADVAAAPPDDRIEAIDRWTDLDTLLTTFVVDRAIRHDDGPMHWYCFAACEPHNFYWYEDPSTSELTLIPWDLDNAFDALLPGTAIGNFIAVADPWGAITDDCGPFPFGTFGLLQRSAACDPLIGALATLDDDFERIRAELLAGPMSEPRVREQIDAWAAQIAPAVAEAADLHDDAPAVATWQAALATLDQALAASRSGDGR